MSISNQFSIASLYDGGWRYTDKKELMNDYFLSQEEAAEICEALADMEDSKKTFNFSEIKEKLKARTEKTTHFTKQFLVDFVEAMKTWKRNFIHDIDDSYLHRGYVRLFHSYDKVYNSDFYNKNSCGYCVFLEIINS